MVREEEHSESVLKELYDIVEHGQYKEYNEAEIGALNEKLLGIALRHQVSLRRGMSDEEYKYRLHDMNPVEKLRYLSRTYFDCEPILIKPRIME